jgi:hypothetical protein
LYGFNFWTLTLREKHRLRVFENRVLRRIFRPQRDEIIVGWRNLHYNESNNLCSSPNIIKMVKLRRMRWSGQVAGIEEVRNACRVLVGKRGGKRPLGRSRRRWSY